MRAFLLLTVLVAAACSQNPSAYEGSASQAEAEVFEAVFRYQFEHNASGLQQNAARYCLSLPGDAPPDEGFLRRFAGNRPPVVAAGDCDRESGKDLFFRVDGVEWEGDDEARVRGGYWEGNLSASQESYIVVREGGRWGVKEARLEVIS